MNNQETGMSLIVKTITRLTVGLILIYGFYVALHADRHPGGGFAGGLIIALSFIHILLAFGKDAALKKVTPGLVLGVLGSAALLFLAIALVKMSGTRSILPAFTLLGDIAASFAVGMGLFAIFLALALIYHYGAKE